MTKRITMSKLILVRTELGLSVQTHTTGKQTNHILKLTRMQKRISLPHRNDVHLWKSHETVGRQHLCFLKDWQIFKYRHASNTLLEKVLSKEVCVNVYNNPTEFIGSFFVVLPLISYLDRDIWHVRVMYQILVVFEKADNQLKWLL